MKLIRIAIGCLLTCGFPVAQGEEAEPYFGYSGVYQGTVTVDGQLSDAEFKVVEFEGEIRGVINTKLTVVDDYDTEWTGTTVFVRGQRTANGVSIKMTDHQCSYVTDFCKSKKRVLSRLNLLPEFSIYKRYPDYILYKVTFKTVSSSGYSPFDSAEFIMKSTISMTEPDSKNPIYGVWHLFGYGSKSIIYSSSPSHFDQINLALFEIDGQPYTNIFTFRRSGWNSANDYLNSISLEPHDDPSEKWKAVLLLRWNDWRYHINFTGGYAFGVVRNTSEVNHTIDFESVFWGFRSLPGPSN